MSKQQKKNTPAQTKSNDGGLSFDKFIPEKYQTPALLLLILLLILVFFSPVMFGNKTTSSGDLIQGKSLRQYATREHDGVTLWNPYIFCGMPAVATSTSPRYYDLTVTVYAIAANIYTAFSKEYNARFTFNFLILGFAAFFFMRRFGTNRGVSLLVALATIFSTGILVLFFIGHTSKLVSLAILPFILMMLFKFQKEITMKDILLLTLGMHLLVFSAHVQIVFYFGLAALFYFIYFFIRAFAAKDKFLQKQLIKSIGVFAVTGLIALLMSFDNYSQLYQYKPYSTRGTKSLAETENIGSSAQDNAYEYATNWSFSPGEVLTFIVPSYYGFGRSTYNGPLSQNQDVEVHTYFGQMPSVDAAMYMGIIIFALGLFALFTRWKEPMVQFFGLLLAIFILLSFGKNFPLLYNLFYHYFPLFDNFRVPSMTLHIVQIIFPILAGFGVMKIISLRNTRNAKFERFFKNTSITFTALFIIALLFNGSIASWFTQRINDYAVSLGQTQESQMFTALAEYLTNMFTSDLMIAVALLALTSGISYAYVTSKLNKELFITGLIIFILFDLFRVGNRGASYIEAEQANQMFAQPGYISVIKNQRDKGPYRILNLQRYALGSVTNNGNYNVYFLQEDLSGYSAAKPRSYQDIIDITTPANFTLWRMLGVKYLVTDKVFPLDGFALVSNPQDSTTFVYRNEKALPRVYFVDEVEQKSSMDILTSIRDNKFDPKKTAYVEKLDFKFDKGDSTASSVITEYKDEYITVNTSANRNNFLFFGTTYLPGWKAFIDGTETIIHKANHGFMGIVIPQGKHKVEFIYEPKGFVLGKYLSLGLNVIVMGSFLFLIITPMFNRKKINER